LIKCSIGEKGKKGRDGGGRKKKLAMSTLNTGRNNRKEEDRMGKLHPTQGKSTPG
jgi:hypothetical protein